MTETLAAGERKFRPPQRGEDLRPQRFVIGDGCHGTINGIRVGTLDTPPPPNPNTCPGVLSVTNVQAGPAGGAFSVTLTVGPTCPWTASSGAGFVTITLRTSGAYTSLRRMN